MIGNTYIGIEEHNRVIAECDRLRAELARLQSPAPVAGGVTEPVRNGGWVRCTRWKREGHDAVWVDEAEALAASRLPAIKTGEVEALEIVRRIAETKLEEDDDDYEMDVDIAFSKLSEIVNDCRAALRAQATTEETKKES